MLNPIENVIKNEKSHKAVHESTSCCLPRSRRAATAVETKIDEAMATITQQDCARCCQHMQDFFAAVLRNEDMAPGL